MTTDEIEKALKKHDPAFPVAYDLGGEEDVVISRLGLSRRDYFAAAALTGIVTRGVPLTTEGGAELAYAYADAMLAAGKVGP